MTTAKNEGFIWLWQENCYLVWRWIFDGGEGRGRVVEGG